MYKVRPLKLNSISQGLERIFVLNVLYLSVPLSAFLLTLANSETLLWKGFRFHVSCLTCEICAKSLPGKPFVARKNDEAYQFFDMVCNTKKFGDDPNFEVCDSDVQGR